MDHDVQSFRETLVAAGESDVRTTLAANGYTASHAKMVRSWLTDLDRERREAAERRELALISATEAAAKAGDGAKWAAWAAASATIILASATVVDLVFKWLHGKA